MTQATGVKRLDELLKGGVPDGTFTLVFGPPFFGKEVLSRIFFLEGLRQDVSGIYVTTTRTAAELRKQLAAMDPHYLEAEASGRARFIDTYSATIGAEDGHPSTEFVDGPMNFNAITTALNAAQKKVALDKPVHRIVFDSVSTLAAYTNAQTAFRFMQVFVGRAKRAGATGLLLLDQGMHTEAEIQTFKHLVDGVLEFTLRDNKHLVRAEGMGLTEYSIAVEYHFNEREFEITGSFAAGRIY